MAAPQEALSLDIYAGQGFDELAAGASGAAAQPVAATVVDIEDDDGDVLEPQPKHQRILEPPPTCKDQIKWIGDLVYVLRGSTQLVYCGKSIMALDSFDSGRTAVRCLTCEDSGISPDCLCFPLKDYYAQRQAQ